MRYLIKGGVWKNSEDETLKAAVMKYGLNQWDRIASLLQRKSAKQCKQRWYEWLDPAIKKTEWTREEDEKLFNLFKIFPQQWRTIAPLVGRTPQQCVDRYDRLIDQYQGKDSNDPNDPRRLKPGEIDPNPESKPARPDPIDMDEDEKEMLAEARVRLANTKGKKAKRLIRERMVEQARRLAQIQKKRELKIAGVEQVQEFILKKRKKKGIEDYNKEIPFERMVPGGQFETKDEKSDQKIDLSLQQLTYQQLEGQMKFQQEETFKKKDEKTIKKLLAHNLDQAVKKLTKDQEKLFENKSKLILPSPQIQDKELEQLGKLYQNQNVSEVQNPATQALVGNFNQKELTMTPMRTPRVPDNVMREAKNSIALQQGQTPLLGGQNLELGQQNINQNRQFEVPQTPNALKKLITPAGQQLNSVQINSVKGGTTPSIFGQTPSKQGIFSSAVKNSNQEWEEISEQVSEFSGINENKLKILRENTIRQQIKKEIQNISKPKHEIQIEIPELFEEENTHQLALDQEDLLRIQKEKAMQEIEKQLRAQNLAIQKNLPRPFQIPNQVYEHIYQKKKGLGELRREAEILMENEMLKLLSFDNQNYPFAGCKGVKFETSLDHFDLSELQRSSMMIKKEIEGIKKSLNIEDDSEMIEEIQKKQFDRFQYDSESQKIVDMDKLGKEKQIKILRIQSQIRTSVFLKEQQKLAELEKKVSVLVGGYRKILKNSKKELNEKYEEIYDKSVLKDVYEKIKIQEDRNFMGRQEELKQFYSSLEYKYSNLKQIIRELEEEKKELIEEEGLFSQNGINVQKQ